MVDVPIVEVARFVFGWADNQRTKKQIEVGERTLEKALSVYNDNKGLLSENDKRTIEQKFQESRRLQGKVATRSWLMKPLSARTFKLKTAETLAETITLSGTAREKHVLGCRTGALRGPQAGDGVEVWHNGDRIYWCADSNVQVRFMIQDDGFEGFALLSVFDADGREIINATNVRVTTSNSNILTLRKVTDIVAENIQHPGPSGAVPAGTTNAHMDNGGEPQDQGTTDSVQGSDSPVDMFSLMSVSVDNLSFSACFLSALPEVYNDKTPV